MNRVDIRSGFLQMSQVPAIRRDIEIRRNTRPESTPLGPGGEAYLRTVEPVSYIKFPKIDTLPSEYVDEVLASRGTT